LDSQTFATSATTTHVTLSRPDAVVQTTSGHRDGMTITYDATSKTYSIQTGGLSGTFAESDVQPTPFAGETIYSNQDGRLTLVTLPYYSTGIENRYVGMGYWQRNVVSPGVQETGFTTFTYGLETPAAAVPRTGAAHWLTDVFGMLTVPTRELRTVQGSADFEVDFAAGAFRLNGNLSEVDVVSGGGKGGALTLQSGGLLSSDSSFGGFLSYQSSDGILHGSLAGQFYGPGAEEIGASFSAEGGGNVLTGAMTGQRTSLASTSDGIRNISLTNLMAPERLGASPGVELAVDTAVSNRFNPAIVTVDAEGLRTVAFNYQYDVDPKDIFAGNPNFVTYRPTINGTPATIAVYKIGSDNAELALTYTSFVSWSWARGLGGAPNSGGQPVDVNYGIFGIRTPRDLMTVRTGSATYDGVLYGKGASFGALYDLTGTSRFDVDFTSSRYSGSLDINGTTSGGTVIAFGQFGFAAALGFGEMAEASITGASVSTGAIHSIRPQFYGPSGQEIGAAFMFNMSHPVAPTGLVITGVALAKSP
jgi:hypothetical protein